MRDDELSWAPAAGTGWMTVGQLLMHCAAFGCGKAVRGFVTGDWGQEVHGGGPETSLFQQLLRMIAHLAQHKGQLFYCLKLMGKDVTTVDLWGS